MAVADVMSSTPEPAMWFYAPACNV